MYMNIWKPWTKRTTKTVCEVRRQTPGQHVSLQRKNKLNVNKATENKLPLIILTKKYIQSKHLKRTLNHNVLCKLSYFFSPHCQKQGCGSGPFLAGSGSSRSEF